MSSTSSGVRFLNPIRDMHEKDIEEELGFVPFDRAGRELLFNLLSQRYERRSTIVTTNIYYFNKSDQLKDDVFRHRVKTPQKKTGINSVNQLLYTIAFLKT